MAISNINRSNIDSFIKSIMNDINGKFKNLENSAQPSKSSSNNNSALDSKDSQESSQADTNKASDSQSAFSSSKDFDETNSQQMNSTESSNKENIDPENKSQSSCGSKSAFGKPQNSDGYGTSPTNATSPMPMNGSQQNPTSPNKPDTKTSPTNATSPTNSTGTPEQQRFLELVNNHRKANGLGPVKLSPELNAAAEKYSKTQSDMGKMDHSVDGTKFGDRAKASGYKGFPNGENVAYNSGDSSPEKIFEMWKNSPGHNANMLSKDATEIGYGTHNGYATQVLGIG